MRELSVRKKLRLNSFDYSQSGCYFLTLCIKDRHELLGAICVGANCVRPQLSEIGQIVENEISILSSAYGEITVGNYVIMPNHIHMIVVIAEPDGRTQFAPTLSRMMKQFKGSITKKIGYSIWQRSFHDHIIRNETDYRYYWEYIENNPIRWSDDEYHAGPTHSVT